MAKYEIRLKLTLYFHIYIILARHLRILQKHLHYPHCTDRHHTYILTFCVKLHQLQNHSFAWQIKLAMQTN